jgi:hypothetical protein
VDTERMCAAWIQAANSLNEHGNLDGFGALLHENCVFEHVGTSRDEIMTALQANVDAGWLRHDTVSVHAAGSVLVALARNTDADGSTAYVGGVVRFDDDGKVVYLAAADEASPLPT